MLVVELVVLYLAVHYLLSFVKLFVLAAVLHLYLLLIAQLFAESLVLHFHLFPIVKLLVLAAVLHLYRVRKGDLALLVLSAIFTLVVITLISEPVRLVLRGYWLTLTS